MRTWSVVSQKAGAEKPTLLLHVAIAAMAKGLAVSVIDLDPQRSAEQWSELRETRTAPTSRQWFMDAGEPRRHARARARPAPTSF